MSCVINIMLVVPDKIKDKVLTVWESQVVEQWAEVIAQSSNLTVVTYAVNSYTGEHTVVLGN